MQESNYEIDREVFKEQIWQMKGQAVSLFSYHLFRDYIIPNITGEYQSAILYWAGKDLADLFQISTLEQLNDLFLEMGLGHLTVHQNHKQVKIFTLHSPFFLARQVEKNSACFALECGFLTQSLAMIEQTETEGDFKVENKGQELLVQFTVYLEDPKRSTEKTT